MTEAAEIEDLAPVTAPGRDVSERVLQLLAGDDVQAAWLYDNFADRLYQRLLQRYGYLGRAEVEDVLQETYVVVLRHGARVTGRFVERHSGEIHEAQVERFLWDQACGIAVNHSRRAWRQRTVPLEPPRADGERPAPPIADPGPGLERSLLAEDLLRALDACLAKGRRRVYLYYKMRLRDGLKPAEISHVTGWSMKATYKLRRAFQDAAETCARRLGLRREKP